MKLKAQRARQDLLASLGSLRQLVKEVGGNYLAGLQADVAAVEQATRQVRSDEAPNRKQLAQFQAMLNAINALDVKPQKGRRRDLKELDRVISKLSDMTSNW